MIHFEAVTNRNLVIEAPNVHQTIAHEAELVQSRRHVTMAEPRLHPDGRALDPAVQDSGARSDRDLGNTVAVSVIGIVIIPGSVTCRHIVGPTVAAPRVIEVMIVTDILVLQ